MSNRRVNLHRGGIQSNVDLPDLTKRQRRVGHEREILIEEGSARPTTGAGAVPVTDWEAPTLVNYDQLKQIEAFKASEKLMLSPIIKVDQATKSVRAKLYTDSEWGAVWAGTHCYSCDRKHDEAAMPEWAVAFSEQKCQCCGATRGRNAMEQSSIWYGPLSSIHKDSEQVAHEPWNTSVQARRSRWQSEFGHHSRNSGG